MFSFAFNVKGSVCLFVILFYSSHLLSQDVDQLDLTDTVPFGSNVKKATLKNGLTYYLCKTDLQPGKAFVKLVVKNGADLETQDQVQAAHVLEHILLNRSSKNFPQNSFPQFLVKNEIAMNGSAGRMYTDYIFEFKYDVNIISAIFTAMSDWLSGQSDLSDRDIEDEKKIVAEELRRNGVPESRLMEMVFPSAQKAESKYSSDVKVGISDVLSLQPSEIRKFYSDWFKISRSSLIVVGDIDPGEVEKNIISLFGKIMPSLNANNLHYQDSHFLKRRIIIETLPVNNSKDNYIKLLFPLSDSSRLLVKDFKTDILLQLSQVIMKERLSLVCTQDQAQGCNSMEFDYLNSNSGESIGHRALVFSGSFRQERPLRECVKTLLKEQERVIRFGFSEGEFTKAMRSMKEGKGYFFPKRLVGLTERYVSNFIYGMWAPSLEIEHQLLNRFLSEIKLTELNESIHKCLSGNFSVGATVYENTSNMRLDDQSIDSCQKEVKAVAIERFVYPAARPSITVNFDSIYPLKGSPHKFTTTNVKELGITALHFKNGITVVLKAGDSSSQKINLSGMRHQPVKYGNEDYNSMKRTISLFSEFGIGELNKSQLDSYKAAHSVNLSPDINQESAGFSGACSLDNLEVLLQLLYRYFMPVKVDTAAFEKKKTEMRRYVKESDSYADELSRLLGYYVDLSFSSPSLKELEKITLQGCINAYSRSFSSANNYTFVLTGVKDMDKTIALVSRYFGRLPSKKIRTARDITFKPAGKAVAARLVNPNLNNQAVVRLFFISKYNHNPKDDVLIEILSRVIEYSLLDRIRVKEAATYTLSAGVKTLKLSARSRGEICQFNIHFLCDPQKTDYLVKAAQEEIEKLKVDALNPSFVQKAIAVCRELKSVDKMKSIKWAHYLAEQYAFLRDPKEILNAAKVIDTITETDIRDAAKRFLDKNSLAVHIESPLSK